MVWAGAIALLLVAIAAVVFVVLYVITTVVNDILAEHRAQGCHIGLKKKGDA